tara:strand:- start:2290 stop:2862 length:573 start_codon:yes stop_codon:yes gene_type:complete
MMENRVYKLALGFITAALLLSVLWPYEEKLIDWKKPADYKVLESDELYFNNTRIVQYRTEESDALNQQGFKVHRSTKALNDTAYPVLNFAIINYWRNDLAYIVCEPNLKRLFQDTATITVGDTTLKLVLDYMDYNDHYAFAALMFQNIVDYQKPYIIQGQDSLLLFGTQPNLKNNMVVLKDYFRLIGRFQ